MSNCSFQRSLQKSKWAITLFYLFLKERPRERSLFRSFKKSDKNRNCSFSLSKRANELKWAKNEGFSISLIFRSKKRAIPHFQNERMLNPAAAGLGNCSFLLFSKEQLSHRSLIHSFRNSDWAIACSFALLKKSKWAIALFRALCIRANEQLLFT